MSLSARNHWIVLRATAIAAIPLCVWLVLNILGLIGAPYEVFIAWLKSPVNSVLLILFVLVNFYHAALGAHEIIEDYVHNEALKSLSLKLKVIVFFMIAAVCILSVLKIALSG